MRKKQEAQENISIEKKDFNFFIPLDIEKGKKGLDKVVKIRGVASTRDVDSDQEVLEPSGFLLDKFLSSGFFNYNHKSSSEPTAIVGEPTDAYVKSGDLIVEGFLYSDSKKAKEIVELSDVLKKNSPNRRLGFSIEGKALARDPFNKKRITKALITGCAITPTPKNPSTLVDVIKGDVGYIEPIYEVVNSNGGDIEYIIDIIDGDGFRRTVDKELNIKVVKMTTGDMSPAYPESVEGTKRKGKRGIKNVVGSDFFEKNRKVFTKSEVYEQIFRIFTNDIEKAKEIYSLIESIESLKSPNMDIKVTPESIEKAKQILKLAAEEDKNTENLTKAEEAQKLLDAESATEKSKKDKEAADNIQKGADEDSDDYDGIEDENVKKAFQGLSKAMASMNSQLSTISMSVGKAAGVKEEDLGHSEENKNGGQITKLSKAEQDELDKEAAKVNPDPKVAQDLIVKGVEDALSPKFAAIGQLYIDQKEKNEELESTITKALDTIEELKSQPVGAKAQTITKSFQERFENKDGAGAEEGKTQMSLSRDKGALVDKLYDLSNIEKGENVDQGFITAMQELEASGTFSNPQIIARLNKEQNIQVVQ